MMRHWKVPSLLSFPPPLASPTPQTSPQQLDTQPIDRVISRFSLDPLPGSVEGGASSCAALGPLSSPEVS